MTAKLPYVPEENGYSVRHGNETVSVRLGGGASRSRADFIGAAHEVGASWLLDRIDFMEFQNFINVSTGRGALSFLADLVVDFWAPTQYKCKMVPNSMRTNQVKGMSYRVSMDLEVEQVTFVVGTCLFATAGQITLVSSLPGSPDLQVLFAPGNSCQIVGAAKNNGVNTPVNLDGIYIVSTIPTPAIMNLTAPAGVNPAWTTLAGYPSGLSGNILSVALVKVPT